MCTANLFRVVTGFS